jgi:hypothetical protein
LDPVPTALTASQLGSLSFLAGVAFFGALMLLNAGWDTAAELVLVPRRSRSHARTPTFPKALGLYARQSHRVLPVPPWERPCTTMPQLPVACRRHAAA